MSLISGTAELSCNQCTNTFGVDAWDIDLSPTGSEERSMGPEVFYDSVTALCCPKCGSEIELTYELSEYPVGIVDYQEVQATGARVTRTFQSVAVSFEEQIYSVEEQGRLLLPSQPSLIAGFSLCVSQMVDEIARYPQKLYALNPRQFEELIAEIFAQHHFSVDLTRRTRDGGRDIIAVRSDLDIPVKYIIECKRYSMEMPVGVGLVRNLYGVQMQEGANKSVLATTSRFTQDAKKFATDANTTSWHMALKEFDDVAKWAREAAQLQKSAKRRP
jgi:restriction system protein